MRGTTRFALLLGMCVVATPSVARAQWYPYPPLYPYRYHPMDNLRSAVRLEVTPKEAEVYVDGYYAGIVDDFNGTFQRLRELESSCAPISQIDGKQVINLASNNYLGLTTHPKLIEAAIAAS